MSDSKDLISLNCPNCQAPLSCKSTEMTVICEHCGTSVLIKDFITKSRVNSKDKLESSLAMAENAFKTKDWKSAYKYYESVCKITKSDEDLAIFNILSCICGKIEPSAEIIENCNKIDVAKRKIILDALKTHIESLRVSETKAATNKYKDTKTRNKIYQSINSKYVPMLDKVNTEIKMISPLKCICGNMLEYNEETCSNCSKTRQQILTELDTQEVSKKKVTTMAIIALVILFFSWIFGSSAFSHLYHGSGVVSHWILAIIGLAVFVALINGKLKNIIVDFISEKTPIKSDIVNKILLPVTIAVPLVLMAVGGMFMNPEDSNINDSSSLTENVIETTEQSTEKITESITKVTEKLTKRETEPITEKPTEPPTEESTEAEAEEIIEETEPEIVTHDYVINYNTGKFHKPSCYTIEDADNIGTYTGTKEELEEQGYEACKKCKPY